MKLFNFIGIEGDFLKCTRTLVGAYAPFKNVLYNLFFSATAHILIMRRLASKYSRAELNGKRYAVVIPLALAFGLTPLFFR